MAHLSITPEQWEEIMGPPSSSTESSSVLSTPAKKPVSPMVAHFSAKKNGNVEESLSVDGFDSFVGVTRGKCAHGIRPHERAKFEAKERRRKIQDKENVKYEQNRLYRLRHDPQYKERIQERIQKQIFEQQEQERIKLEHQERSKRSASKKQTEMEVNSKSCSIERLSKQIRSTIIEDDWN